MLQVQLMPGILLRPHVALVSVGRATARSLQSTKGLKLLLSL